MQAKRDPVNRRLMVWPKTYKNACILAKIQDEYPNLICNVGIQKHITDEIKEVHEKYKNGISIEILHKQGLTDSEIDTVRSWGIRVIDENENK